MKRSAPRPTPSTPPRKAAAKLATPQGCTHFKLRQLLRRVARLYDQQAALAGLKTTQYSLLSSLQALGPVRPGELARDMRLDASTLTRNLKPLIDAGWVALGPGADGRSRQVELTSAGRAKRLEGRTHWQRAQLGLNEKLGTERVMALHGLIDEALERLADAPEGDLDE